MLAREQEGKAAETLCSQGRLPEESLLKLSSGGQVEGAQAERKGRDALPVDWKELHEGSKVTGAGHIRGIARRLAGHGDMAEGTAEESCGQPSDQEVYW